MTGPDDRPAPAGLAPLFLLGDSISLQYGPFLADMLADRFLLQRKEGQDQALANLDLPVGANGGDSSHCLRYVQASDRLREINPPHFLLNCGLHDIKADPATGQTQTPLDQYTANLHALIEVLRTRGTSPIWLTTTPVDEAAHNPPSAGFYRYNRDVRRYNQAAAEIMQTARVPVIDLHRFTLSLGPPADTLYDGRHAHESVRRLQAAFIAGWLAHALPDTPRPGA